ncbi:MAG: lactonase family protein [Tannerella sp.]|nr:lactonase family protein [Tannerella sp.]
MKTGNEVYMIVGSYAEASDTGIYLYRLNIDDGSSELLKTVTGIADPSFQALSSDGQFIYSVGEGKEKNAKAYAYSFDRKTGDIRLLNVKEVGSSGPCHIWTDSGRRLVVTANYSGGSVSVLPVLPDGSLGEAEALTYDGGTPGSARQEAPHLHQIYTSPDEKYLYANDLGTDRIYKYELRADDANGSGRLKLTEGDVPYFSLPAGEGPRHTTFGADGRFAYLISELSGRVAVLRYEDGNLIPIQFIEADSLKAAGSAEIQVSPDGRFLYASNRLKGDGLAIFSIDSATGLLTKIGYQPTGAHPRYFSITPNGKFLLCACRDDNVIQIFEIDNLSGLLKNIGKDIKVSKPVCLNYVEIL